VPKARSRHRARRRRQHRGLNPLYIYCPTCGQPPRHNCTSRERLANSFHESRIAAARNLPSPPRLAPGPRPPHSRYASLLLDR